VVIVGLVMSGLTAFPLLHELNLLAALLAGNSRDIAAHDGLASWVLTAREGLEVTYRKYPFIAYATDWLAFGHLMIALFFILPWRDPVRYEGVLKVGAWPSCRNLSGNAFSKGNLKPATPEQMVRSTVQKPRNT
jgi:hypothetical protein